MRDFPILGRYVPFRGYSLPSRIFIHQAMGQGKGGWMGKYPDSRELIKNGKRGPIFRRGPFAKSLALKSDAVESVSTFSWPYAS